MIVYYSPVANGFAAGLFCAPGLSYEFSENQPRKREVLSIQVEFDKIISVAERKMCFLTA
jgi:hypothetical protein